MRGLPLLLLASALTGGALAENVQIYVSDAGNFDKGPWQILKFDGDGENPQAFITEHLAWPQDILFLEDQNVVLISNLSSNRINRHDASTGAYIDVFADATHLSGPTRMEIGPDGLLYVLQWQGDGVVKRFELDGTPAADFTSVGVPQSIGIDWDGSGNVYVSSFSGASVTRFDAQGDEEGEFISADLEGPTNIWFDDSGDLLVFDWRAGSIKRFDASGDIQGTFITGLSQPEGIDVLPDGNILIGNGGTGSVKMYDRDGNFLRDLIPSGNGDLIRPNAVTVRRIGD